MFRHAAPMFQGFLAHTRKNNFSALEVGFEIKDIQGRLVTAFELARPKTKCAVCIKKPERSKDWNIHFLEEAMELITRYEAKQQAE